MMATSARVRDAAQIHRLKITLGVLVLGLIVAGVIIWVQHAKNAHHHVRDQHPIVPTITLTALTTTPYPSSAPWTFTVQVTDVSVLKTSSVGVTPMYTFEHAGGGNATTHPTLGTMVDFLPAEPRQPAFYRGSLFLNHVDPVVGKRMLEDQARGLVKPVINVSAITKDGRPLQWLCVPVMKMTVAGSAASSAPVKCTVFIV